MLRLRRLATVVVVAPIVVLAAALPASAHVTVHSYDAVRGGSDAVLSFRTPNEMDNATTVKLQVFLPTDTPLLGVLVQPLDGWQFAVKNITLNKPVQTDDGPITQAVSEVTWTGGHIPVGGYQDFDIDVSDLPKVPSLTFKALQTYSNGKVVRWIETAPKGGPEPDFPAPTLHLPRHLASTAAGGHSSKNLNRGLAIAGLALGALSLVVAGFALLRRWEAG
ncbi:MAG TPA: YcnI family protein [Mycobacteriales bacterium]|nr:YcnI family protein [Mycobacteriales bacterium]